MRQEKRRYWRQRIDSIQLDEDLYKVVQWHKLQPAIPSPPLVIRDKTIEDTEEKAHALRKALLERFTDAENIEGDPLEIPTIPRRNFPRDTYISREEMTAATTTGKST